VKASTTGGTSKRLEGVGALGRFSVPDFDCAVGRSANDAVSVDAVDGVVDIRSVAAEFLQGLARFKPVASNRRVERGA